MALAPQLPGSVEIAPRNKTRAAYGPTSVTTEQAPRGLNFTSADGLSANGGGTVLATPSVSGHQAP